MANSNITKAQFTPYTFDEMLKPISILQQKHDALATANMEMASKLSILEHYLPKESKAYKEIYAPYMEQLGQMSRQLAQQGILDSKGNFSPEMVNKLRDLKVNFGKTFIPLEDAIKRYKLRKENDVMIKNKDPHMISVMGEKDIDDFIADPSLGTDSYISGDQFYADAAKAFQALSRGEFNSPRLQKFAPFYDLFSQTAGMTPAQVINHIKNSKGGKFAEEFLQTMFENQLDTYGYTDKLDSHNKRRLFNEFSRALPHLTGPTQHQLVDNGMRAMMAMRMQREAEEQDQMVKDRSYIVDDFADGSFDNPELAERFRNSFFPEDPNIPNKDPFFPSKRATNYYPFLSEVYNENPVLKKQVEAVFNNYEKTGKLKPEEKALLKSVADMATKKRFAKPFKDKVGFQYTEASINKAISNIPYDALKGINVPAGMDRNKFISEFKNLQNPKISLNSRTKSLVFEGNVKNSDGESEFREFSLPLKQVVSFRDIYHNYYDPNGNTHQETYSIDRVFDEIAKLENSREESKVRKARNLKDAIAKQYLGYIEGYTDVDNLKFGEGQPKIDLTTR